MSYKGTIADIRSLVLIQNKQVYVVLIAGKFSTFIQSECEQ